jgi:polyhydroxybutyrate depolymerase
MRRFALLGIVLLYLTAARPLYAQSEGIEIDGVPRHYRLHVPQGLDAPAPLLIVLHGGGGSMRQMERFTGFTPIAEREGFIVVYPQGLEYRWNDGRDFEGSTESEDVAFIDGLIEHLLASQPIDPDRIYATGISNGGFMSFRLACQLSERIAGIAAVTASLSEDIAPDCAPQRPLKFLLINGTADPLLPYEGGTVTLPPDNAPRGEVRSAVDSVAFWAAHNHCAPEPLFAALPDSNQHDDSQVEIRTYAACEAATVLYTVVNGGHTWPGGEQYLPVAVIGGTNRDFDASETIWAFFAGAT